MRPARHRAGRVRRSLRSLGRGLSILGMLTATALLLGLAVGPHLFGYRTVTMRSDSMAPSIEAGDVLVLRSQPVHAIRAGQLLTFNAPVPGRPVYTHRVVTAERSGGRTVVTTQGDSNPAPDPWKAQIEGRTAWRAVAVVPHLGWVLGALHHPVVHVVSVWLIPGALCLEVLLRLWRRPAARRLGRPHKPAPAP